eukprot:1151770-Pelagomonas_calceolata.AAC.2
MARFVLLNICWRKGRSGFRLSSPTMALQRAVFSLFVPVRSLEAGSRPSHILKNQNISLEATPISVCCSGQSVFNQGLGNFQKGLSEA